MESNGNLRWDAYYHTGYKLVSVVAVHKDLNLTPPARAYAYHYTISTGFLHRTAYLTLYISGIPEFGGNLTVAICRDSLTSYYSHVQLCLLVLHGV